MGEDRLREIESEVTGQTERERERDGMLPSEALGQAVLEVSSFESAEVGSGANNLPISLKVLTGSFLSSYTQPPAFHTYALSSEWPCWGRCPELRHRVRAREERWGPLVLRAVCWAPSANSRCCSVKEWTHIFSPRGGRGAADWPSPGLCLPDVRSGHAGLPQNNWGPAGAALGPPLHTPAGRCQGSAHPLPLPTALPPPRVPTGATH